MEEVITCKDFTDKTKESVLHPFNPKKLTNLCGCIWELLEGKEIQWLEIKSRVKITQGDIIYIFTEKQIKEINDMILREIEPSEFENLENYYSNDLLITYERA